MTIPAGNAAVLKVLRRFVDHAPGNDHVSASRVRVGFKPDGYDRELPEVLLQQPWCRKVRVGDRWLEVTVRRSFRRSLLSEDVERDLTGDLLAAFEPPSRSR